MAARYEARSLLTEVDLDDAQGISRDFKVVDAVGACTGQANGRRQIARSAGLVAGLLLAVALAAYLTLTSNPATQSSLTRGGHRSEVTRLTAARPTRPSPPCGPPGVKVAGEPPATNPCQPLTSLDAMDKMKTSLRKNHTKLENTSTTTTKTTTTVPCAVGKGNCNVSHCCSGAGLQCYEQGPTYAQCKPSCTAGPDLFHWDPNPWSCKKLGSRAPGSSSCASAGENCIHSQCCSDVGMQCWSKNSTFAKCKVDCTKGGPDMSDADWHPWTCKALGKRSASVSPWVWGQCAKAGQDCSKVKCCSEPGMQCYAQSGPVDSPYYGACRAKCTPGVDPRRSWEPAWTCNEVGARTPGTPLKSATVAPWVPKRCAPEGGNCAASKCCLGADRQCYAKNSTWAECKASCTPTARRLNSANSSHKNASNVSNASNASNASSTSWSCNALGPRSWGLAVKGFPSFFCFSIMRTTGYEVGLIKAQLAAKAGIFQCDGYALLSTDDVITVGNDTNGPVKTIKFKPAVITRSKDNTAGNAKLFINAWDAILMDGRWKQYSWIAKVDPDAVLHADRLRQHMAMHTGEKAFVVNCNAYPTSADFPMMYGALEVFSFEAVEAYAKRGWDCQQSMGVMLASWGEDYFMTHCLDFIGVSRISDWSVLGDNLCLGAHCEDAGVAAFHPFKDIKSWMACWDQGNAR
mmetsp:Transcript_130504/g.278876  ORF Transcript_130504/g.278876 Transcript_130504/m.278876 type:complete len:689 (+) Transcript_130504:110-2176(+)